MKAKDIWTVALLTSMIGLMVFVGWAGIDYLVNADTRALKLLQMVVSFAWLAFTLFLVGFAAMSWSGYRYSKSEMKSAFMAGVALEATNLYKSEDFYNGRESEDLGYDDFDEWFEYNNND